MRSAVLVLVLVLGVSACGSSSSSSSAGSSSSSSLSSSSSTSTSSSSSSSTSANALPKLERALRVAAGKPVPTAISCRLESASERARSPFGSIGGSVYACSLTVRGVPVAYDVQALHNGCFVAERRKPGNAIYGCGAGKTRGP